VFSIGLSRTISCRKNKKVTAHFSFLTPQIGIHCTLFHGLALTQLDWLGAMASKNFNQQL
jgi:hypothetical protein